MAKADAVLFPVVFNNLRRKFKGTDNALWAAELALNPDREDGRDGLAGEALYAIAWAYETGRMATHRAVALDRLKGAQFKQMIENIMSYAVDAGDFSTRFLKEMAYHELDRLGANAVLEEWKAR